MLIVLLEFQTISSFFSSVIISFSIENCREKKKFDLSQNFFFFFSLIKRDFIVLLKRCPKMDRNGVTRDNIELTKLKYDEVNHWKKMTTFHRNDLSQSAY